MNAWGGSADIDGSAHGAAAGEAIPDPPSCSSVNPGYDPKHLPQSLSVHFLGLTRNKWQTVVLMLSQDTTSVYADTRICDIYSVMLGADSTADSNTVKRIESWRDKLFYLIDVGVPGLPALYTPSSQARDIGSPDDDRAKLLVPAHKH